jgi:hypothetical protein
VFAEWHVSLALGEIVEGVRALAIRISKIDLQEVWDFGVFHIGHPIPVSLWND